jgi:hypothetical protein
LNVVHVKIGGDEIAIAVQFDHHFGTKDRDRTLNLNELNRPSFRPGKVLHADVAKRGDNAGALRSAQAAQDLVRIAQ